jgi:hypothetical protein
VILKLRVPDPSRFFGGSEGWGFPPFVLYSVDGVDLSQTMFLFGVETQTTPRPILRMNDEFSVQGMHVHVLKLFDFLLESPHVEVVEPALPETGQRIFGVFETQYQSAYGPSPGFERF